MAKVPALHEDLRAVLGQPPPQSPAPAAPPAAQPAAAPPKARPAPGEPAASASWAQRVQPYLQQAAEMDDSEPVIAHYCRVHAVEQMIRARQREEADDESNDLLMATLEVAEAKKAGLDLQEGRDVMEGFARRVYACADAADRARPPELDRDRDDEVATQLQTASLLVEALAQFYGGELPGALAAAAGYARARAVLLAEYARVAEDCARLGKRPPPPAAPALAEPAPAAWRPAASSPAAPAASPARPGAQAGAPPAAQPVAHQAAQLAAPSAAPPAAQGPSAPRISAALTQAQAALPAAKRKIEAQRSATAAAAALEARDEEKAHRLICEALGLLEGL